MSDTYRKYRTAAIDVAMRRSEQSTYVERVTVLIWAMLAVTFLVLCVSTIFGAGTETTHMFVLPLGVVGAALSALVIMEFIKLVTGAAR